VGAPGKLAHGLLTTEFWSLGVVDAPVAEIVRAGRLPPVRWLPRPGPWRFLADPFAWCEDGVWHVVAEEMDYRRGRGRIVATTLDSDGLPVGGWRPAVAAAAHLSYPSLFRHDGTLHLAPESWEAGRLDAWRLDAAPADWRPAGRPVLPGLAAVDPTLFEHGGRWWLFCTDRLGDPNRDLLLFSASAPWGPWTPHPGNPVRRDACGGRPAGPLFTIDGVLYRPGQDCASRYGGAVVVHRVDRLSPEDYRETAVCRLAPDPDGPWPDGLHTLCPAGPRTLVDGGRRRAHWWSLGLSLWNFALNQRRRRRLRSRWSAA